ncbi:N-acetylgalactosamine 6-sulfatase [Platysternon megacephalum]|uniref:N-acetylgalactosamine 6-sulfatase n=1 Tax=Platysternon megacephalum TaxID=55544 RepID=A0A4D9DIL8_9SAUR|nr:N-acetylgalactosamine 6-sulfatase [Platysternon megacephalum]
MKYNLKLMVPYVVLGNIILRLTAIMFAKDRKFSHILYTAKMHVMESNETCLKATEILTVKVFCALMVSLPITGHHPSMKICIWKLHLNVFSSYILYRLKQAGFSLC